MFLKSNRILEFIFFLVDTHPKSTNISCLMSEYFISVNYLYVNILWYMPACWEQSFLSLSILIFETTVLHCFTFLSQIRWYSPTYWRARGFTAPKNQMLPLRKHRLELQMTVNQILSHGRPRCMEVRIIQNKHCLILPNSPRSWSEYSPANSHHRVL